jgi:hypothetical protein
MQKIILFIMLLLFVAGLYAQQQTTPTAPKPASNNNKAFAHKIVNIQFHYTYIIPDGKLGQRFGTIHNLGFGGLFKTKYNFIYALDASYQFGNVVREDVLYNLTNSAGVIVNSAGVEANLSISQRGFNTFAKIGKIFPLGRNRNSGISVMLGGGMISHKINFNTPNNDIPSLTEDLKKGYDRLSLGPAITGFAGYHFQSRNRFVNFYLGFDYVVAFTKNQRGYNYDQRMPDTNTHTDYYYGMRLGWMIPIYLTIKEEDEYFYH